MGFDGSGGHSRTNGVNSGSATWAADAADPATEIIDEDRHDVHDQDISDSLSQCITKNGETTVTNDIPFSGNQLNNVGDGTARTDVANIGQIQDGDFVFGGASAGSSSAYAITMSPAVTTLVNGMKLRFVANHESTGATTLDVNGLGATDVKKNDGDDALAARDIQSGEVVEVVYVSADSAFHLVQTLHEDRDVFLRTLTLQTTADRPVFTNSGSGLIETRSAAAALTALGAANVDGSDIQTVDGVPTGAAWSPTLSGSGAMTVTGQTIHQATWCRLGPYVFFWITAGYTLGGTTSTNILIPAPVAGSAHATAGQFACTADENGATAGESRFRYDGTDIIVLKAGSANWTLGANAACNVMGFYFA